MGHGVQCYWPTCRRHNHDETSEYEPVNKSDDDDDGDGGEPADDFDDYTTLARAATNHSNSQCTVDIKRNITAHLPSDEKRTTIFPSADVLTDCLRRKTSCSTTFCEEKLHPNIATCFAGQTYNAFQILSKLMYALHDSAIGMKPIIITLCEKRTVELISALVSDPILAQETIKLWETMS